MICGYCGYDFDENEGKKSCGGCSGGCHNVHCPRCNYKNPLETGLIKKLKEKLNRNK
jgi:rubredoxin